MVNQLWHHVVGALVELELMYPCERVSEYSRRTTVSLNPRLGGVRRKEMKDTSPADPSSCSSRFPGDSGILSSLCSSRRSAAGKPADRHVGCRYTKHKLKTLINSLFVLICLHIVTSSNSTHTHSGNSALIISPSHTRGLLPASRDEANVSSNTHDNGVSDTPHNSPAEIALNSVHFHIWYR